MIKGENQHVNVCVRGIIIEDNQVVLTEWLSRSWSFLIGGRIDFGESIMSALHREIMEETGATVTVEKLAYFSENIFTHPDGREFHEYGYYFVVRPDRVICPDNAVIPNPDSEELIIRRAALTEEGLANVWPLFLRDYLPQDAASGFRACPRFLYSRDVDDITEQSQALEAAFGVASL